MTLATLRRHAALSLIGLGLLALNQAVHADGSETLGPPSIPIASGTGIVADGTGMLDQPGTIQLDVPTNATIKQVLAYWEGFGCGEQSDDTIILNGTPVTGRLIGGPDFFEPICSSGRFSSTFRADITQLGLIRRGANTVSVSGMDFDEVNNGAGIMAIIDDGSGVTELAIVDGDDIAWIGWDEPRKTTVPQTFTFPSAGVDRIATITSFFAAVAGPASGGGPLRPSTIVVSTGGTTQIFTNKLGSFDGPEWDTLVIEAKIPAGAASLTIQALSEDRTDSGENPASFVWLASGITIPIPPGVASLGDRVWEDLNGDGKQNCVDGGAGDPANPADGIIGNAGDSGPECDVGVPGVRVFLGMPDGAGGCDSDGGPSTTTDDYGFYGFGDLTPDAAGTPYCVTFDKSTVASDFCDATLPDGTPVNLGAPLFTTRNQGEDDSDSDADPVTGDSESVTLFPGGRDLTVDAGLVCPGKIGDFVWLDEDEQGDQTPGEPGVPGATVDLYTCEGEYIATRTTDGSGMYMFGAEPGFDLPPGNYYLVFTDPDGRPFTTPNAVDDALDSDCGAHPDGIPGATACFTVQGSRAVDLTRDCGVLPPPPPQCNLLLDKQCRVDTPPEPPFTGTCKGRLKQFTVIWGGDKPIKVVPRLGTVGDAIVDPDEAATFSGPYSTNDIYVDLYDAATNGSLGFSVFHMSCSDDDFDGPEDCGKLAGDAKGISGAVNTWYLEGFVDAENKVLECNSSPPDGPFSANCTFEAPPAPSCETLGKPKELVFQYVGGGCAASDNSQPADKAFCKPTGSLAGSVSIEAAGREQFDGDYYTVNPTSVAADGMFAVSFGGSDLKANSFIRLTDSAGNVELNGIHTSCSQPLAVGDQFGSLKLVGMNGQDSGVDVTYRYGVTNNGDDLTEVGVTDIPVGTITSGQTLAGGETKTYTAMTRIFGTTTNTARATGQLSNGSVCLSNVDTVTVEAVIPPCSVGIVLDGVDDDRIKFKLTNNDPRGRVVTLDSMTVAFPTGRGDLSEVKLDGAIYKRGDSSNPAIGTPATVDTTGPTVWTQADVTKRQLDPGETRLLEIKTTGKSNRDLPFELTLVFGEGCEVHVKVENRLIVP